MNQTANERQVAYNVVYRDKRSYRRLYMIISLMKKIAGDFFQTLEVNS